MNNSTPPLVSVIIPIYNTADYVIEAINSICNQTLKEIEIIAIDDGSTDCSLELVTQFSHHDDRIIVFSQKNKGVATTRNFGLSIARGNYIYFMDSDDIIEINTLEYSIKKCIENNLDFVTFNAKVFCENNQIRIPVNSYNRDICLSENIIYSGLKALENQIDRKCYTPSVCLSLINRKYLNKIKLSFYDGIIHEDQLFTTMLYLNADKVGYISSSFYNRRYRVNSIMTNTFQWRNIQCYLLVADQIKKNQTISNKEIINKYLFQMLNAAFWSSYILPLNQRFKLLTLCSIGPYRKFVNLRTCLVLLFKKYIHK